MFKEGEDSVGSRGLEGEMGREDVSTTKNIKVRVGYGRTGQG